MLNNKCVSQYFKQLVPAPPICFETLRSEKNPVIEDVSELDPNLCQQGDLYSFSLSKTICSISETPIVDNFVSKDRLHKEEIQHLENDDVEISSLQNSDKEDLTTNVWASKILSNGKLFIYTINKKKD